MRTKTIKLYKLDELSYDARARALRDYQERVASWDIPWQEETIESLKAVIEATAGVKLKDWSIGAYNRGNFLRVEFSQDEAAELSGPRAMAWLENNLLSGLRVSGAARFSDESPKNTRAERTARFWRVRKGGQLDHDSIGRRGLTGTIPACPLTGYCMDDDYLEELQKSVKSGSTLKEAFQGLADVAMHALESECEYQQSEEAFKERADINEMEFNEDGELMS